MSENKENFKVKERCRNAKGDVSERNPLKTLSYHSNVENCLAGPSQVSKATNTGFVTYKKHYDDFAIYQQDTIRKPDDKAKNNQKKPSHDKATEEKTDYLKTENENKLAPVISISLKTPLVIIKTPNDVQVNTQAKRVKRSLKRPQAWERGPSPPVSAKSYQFSIFSNSDIKFNVLSAEGCFDPLNEAYLLDNLHYLLNAETYLVGEPKIRKASRACVINWIINVNGSSSNPAIVQQASWYFDSYLRSTWVPVDGLQLVAAACFWIASKINGRSISAKRLVKYSGQAFLETELEDAERSVLKKLQFQVLPVAPCDFVPYLSWCSARSEAGLVADAALFLCQCGIMVERELGDEFPSVVAAAAVRTALLLLGMDANTKNLEACSIYQAAAKKASNLQRTSAQLREAVRAIASDSYEYKAPLFKHSGPPHYISSNIVRAVNSKDIMLMDVGNI